MMLRAELPVQRNNTLYRVTPTLAFSKTSFCAIAEREGTKAMLYLSRHIYEQPLSQLEHLFKALADRTRALVAR